MVATTPAIPAHTPTPGISAAPEHSLACMEVWGGSRAFEGSVAITGHDVAVRCEPYEKGEHGGDIYYVSNCAAGLISRVVLADVAGHGSEVAAVARRLRDLMRTHINTVDQSRFANALNDAFSDPAHGGRFATAVLLTYFAPTDHLIVCNTGHPRPLWYQAARDRWNLLDPDSDAVPNARPSEVGVRNLPLGVLPDTNYEQFAVKLNRGDIVLTYSDAFIEATNAQGTMLGEQGLLSLANTLSPTDRAKAVDTLQSRVLEFIDSNNASALNDDATMIAMQHHAGDPPKMSLRERIHSLGKMLGLGHVHTEPHSTPTSR